MARSLTEFATNHQPHGTPVPWITTIPEYDEVKAAWQSGKVGIGAIRRWLIEECGYQTELATENRVAWIRNHIPRHGS